MQFKHRSINNDIKTTKRKGDTADTEYTEESNTNEADESDTNETALTDTDGAADKINIFYLVRPIEKKNNICYNRIVKLTVMILYILPCNKGDFNK